MLFEKGVVLASVQDFTIEKYHESEVTDLQMDVPHSRIAYFVSPHGFGHAARAAAVMAAIQRIDGSIHFDIFTKVPLWFFEDSLSGPFSYHPLLTDIGLVQETPLDEDIPTTVHRLNDFLPFNPSLITGLAEEVLRLNCELVLCDIAAMGIVAAQEAGVPSVLVENFTWDWIYQGYTKLETGLNKHVAYLQGVYDAADYRVQTEPVCVSHAADLTTLPVSRTVRTPREEIRRRLGIPQDAQVVMVTMGGIQGEYNFLRELTRQRDVFFVIPGGSSAKEVRENLVLLPHHSDFFHPDLISASDVVIGKVGYSTLAEVYHAGVPFGYVTRTHFVESEILSSYIERHMSGLAIEESHFQDGYWISHLQDLCSFARIERKGPNGSEQVARFILTILPHYSRSITSL